MRLIVLLSTFNGAKYLREQLDSLLLQTLDGVEILVRDDGSSDQTQAVLNEYSKKGKLTWFSGFNLGPARSVCRLLQSCGDADYYAFCDQDDVWDLDKLEIAVKTLAQKGSLVPALYCSDVRITDDKLRMIKTSMVTKPSTDFICSTLKKNVPGCTYVFNHAAKELLCRFDADLSGIDLHDWTAFQIIACFGSVVFDGVAHMSYRQHDGNAIGAARGSFAVLIRKIPSFWNGDLRGSRSRQAVRLEQFYDSSMSPENKSWISCLAHYRTDSAKKRSLLRRMLGLDISGRLPLLLLILTNRL